MVPDSKKLRCEIIRGTSGFGPLRPAEVWKNLPNLSARSAPNRTKLITR
jgi:hypothetical protein